MPRFTRLSVLRRPRFRLWPVPTKDVVTSTVNYSGVQWIRSNGQTAGRPPLVLRNPQNDNTKYDYQKNGPEAMVALGAGQYYILYEGLTDQQGAATNFIHLATGTNPWYLTKDTAAYLIAPNTGDWEQGEVCCTTLIRDDVERVYKLYYHGGNNAGPRQIGLMTAPIGPGRVPGTFTRYAGNPIVTDGGAGTWNAAHVADACIIPREDGPWLMFARGADGSNDHTGKWTSNDRGYTWVEYPYNPVIRGGVAGTNIEEHATAPWGFIDSGGRLHLWIDALDGVGIHRILYAYSDDHGNNFVFNPAAVSLPPNPGGNANDPDVIIGDVISGMEDEGLLIFGSSNFNFAAYDGDALGRLDGRGHYWLPNEAVGTPTRPARCFTNKVANSRVTVNAAASLLDQSIFTIYAEIKVPPHNTFRTIYSEDHNVFNKEIFLRLENDGQLGFFYRTPTAAAFTSSTARWDTGQIIPVLWVRRGVADFEMYAGPDFTSIATSTTNAGTDTPGVDGICWGNWNAIDEPLMGWIRQSLTIKGTALTVAQAAQLWNRGRAGGTLPAGVTATCWVQHGSGGAAGPDAAYGGATYGTAVGAGTVVVSADSHPAQTSTPPFVQRATRFYRSRRTI